VTDAEGRLVGTLLFNDLVREAARTSGRLAQDVIKALAVVCAPRADTLQMQTPPTTDLVAPPPTPVREPAMDRERAAKTIVAAAEVGAKP